MVELCISKSGTLYPYNENPWLPPITWQAYAPRFFLQNMLLLTIGIFPVFVSFLVLG